MCVCNTIGPTRRCIWLIHSFVWTKRPMVLLSLHSKTDGAHTSVSPSTSGLYSSRCAVSLHLFRSSHRRPERHPVRHRRVVATPTSRARPRAVVARHDVLHPDSRGWPDSVGGAARAQSGASRWRRSISWWCGGEPPGSTPCSSMELLHCHTSLSLSWSAPDPSVGTTLAPARHPRAGTHAPVQRRPRVKSSAPPTHPRVCSQTTRSWKP
jgi:hypothetical protein